MGRNKKNADIEPPKSDKNNTLQYLTEFLTTAGNSDCLAIVGMKGTGKSSYILKELFEDKKNIVVVTPKAFKPMQIDKKHIVCNFDNFIKVPAEQLKDSAIIFDDCKYYLSSNPNATGTKHVIDILRMSRHQNNAVRLVFHSLNDVAPQMFANIDKLLLFKTVSEIGKFAGIVPEYETIKAAYIEVQANTNQYFCKLVDLR